MRARCSKRRRPMRTRWASLTARCVLPHSWPFVFPRLVLGPLLPCTLCSPCVLCSPLCVLRAALCAFLAAGPRSTLFAVCSVHRSCCSRFLACFLRAQCFILGEKQFYSEHGLPSEVPRLRCALRMNVEQRWRSVFACRCAAFLRIAGRAAGRRAVLPSTRLHSRTLFRGLAFIATPIAFLVGSQHPFLCSAHTWCAPLCFSALAHSTRSCAGSGTWTSRASSAPSCSAASTRRRRSIRTVGPLCVGLCCLCVACVACRPGLVCGFPAVCCGG